MREFTPAGRRPRPDSGLVTIADSRIVLPDRSYTRLWMIADADLWTALQGAGELRVDPARLSFPEWRSQYDWLRGQMARRIPGYSGDYPWWSWGTSKPDLRDRSRHHSPAGCALVRLTLDVPTTEILAFDFGAWHFPISGQFLSTSEAEEENWAILPEAERTRAALEQSWERLFDPDLPRDPDWLGPLTKIQVVFETLRLADVARVKPFKSRPPAEAARTYAPNAERASM